MSNILYMSCHSILEYDELRMFQDLAAAGHALEVYSMGSYINPARPIDDKRPALPGPVNDELVSAMMQGLHEHLVLPALKRFGAVIVMHKPEWVTQNWPVFKEWGGPVIWRSIGQSTDHVEAMLRPMRAEGLHVVRYSPREEKIPGYVGADAVIRFGKYPAEWCGWTGEEAHAAIVGQRILGRGPFCNGDVLDAVTGGYPRRVYGPDNSEWGNAWAGLLGYEEYKAALRRARCLAYAGTVPASYTLVFIEALMTGLPVAAVGPGYANRVFANLHTYEVQDILRHGESGYCTDDVVELRGCVAHLLQDHELAARIGEAGRQRALELFDADKIKLQWLALFQSLGVC
jgi:glycosyltransferase involved in cell wall biosynthesis